MMLKSVTAIESQKRAWILIIFRLGRKKSQQICLTTTKNPDLRPSLIYC